MTENRTEKQVLEKPKPNEMIENQTQKQVPEKPTRNPLPQKRKPPKK
jgi:hypothetical protein